MKNTPQEPSPLIDGLIRLSLALFLLGFLAGLTWLAWHERLWTLL